MAKEYIGVEKRQIPHTPVSDVGFKRFGKPTADRMVQVVCNIALSQIVKPNPNRVSFILVNNSVTAVYVGVTNKVSSSFGLILSAGGGAISRDIETDGQAVTSGLYALCGSDAMNLTLFETYVTEA